MEFQVREEGGVVVVAVSGRLDSVTAPEFEESIRQLINQRATRFVVDFDRLLYISSCGLRGLLLMANLLAQKQGEVCLANVKGNVRSVFNMCRIDEIFKVETSLAAAMTALQEGNGTRPVGPDSLSD